MKLARPQFTPLRVSQSLRPANIETVGGREGGTREISACLHILILNLPHNSLLHCSDETFMDAFYISFYTFPIVFLWGSDINRNPPLHCWVLKSALFCLVKTYLRIFPEHLVTILLMPSLYFIQTDDRSLSFIRLSLRTLTRPGAWRDCWRVLLLTRDQIGWIFQRSYSTLPSGVQCRVYRWVFRTAAILLLQITTGLSLLVKWLTM